MTTQTTRTEAEWLARERELLEANNRYLQEARDARAALVSALANPAQVTDALKAAEQAFEEIRLLLVNCLDEPERSAFWKAVRGRDAMRVTLATAIGAGRSSEPEFETAPDNGTPDEVLAYVLDCARRWVPGARIIGNARAGDIERAIAAIGAGSGVEKIKVPLPDWLGPDTPENRAKLQAFVEAISGAGGQTAPSAGVTEARTVSSLWQKKIDDMGRANGILESQNRELRLRAERAEARTALPIALPDDLFSHQDAWRRALELLRDTAEVTPPDIDDRAYWQHELDVFDRVFAALTAPSAAEGWKTMEGAPKDGTSILAAHDQAAIVVYWQEDYTVDGVPGWSGGETDLDGYSYTYPVTHWRLLPPLPAAPTGAQS